MVELLPAYEPYVRSLASEAGVAERISFRTADLVAEPASAAPVDVVQLSFELAGRFEFAPELKQRLLQLTSERSRMKLLAELLEGAAIAVEREREIAERAQGNGKVDPRG